MSEFVEDDGSDKVRATIVKRYHRGPDGPVEPWEDASFIVYQVCDRYGFLHRNPLPQYERDEKLLEIERERAKKWVKMFANWKGYFFIDRSSEKLRRRVYKGIPDSLRGEAWKKMLNLEQVYRSGVYEQFQKIALENSPDIRQIDLDVNRTYRDHIMFRDRFSVKQQALFNILAAYSMYNTDVGYCQGMSGVAALLLMYMNEEDAFWALSEMLTDRKHAMHGLFVPGFPKLIRFQNHHDKILKKMMPKMFKHLNKEGVHTSLYTLKWFMQCFLDRLPFSLVLRIYDIYMLEGDKILTSMAFHILKLFKKQILKMDLEGIAPLLQEEVPNYTFIDDEVIDSLQETMIELKKSKLDIPPPPATSELPSRPPGTLPERNSFITASKRARMQGDRKSTIEIPMGKPPSPVLNSARSSVSTSPQSNQSALDYRGVSIKQPRAAIIPALKTPPATPPKPLPSYSEFVEQKLHHQHDNVSNETNHQERRRWEDHNAGKGHSSKGSKTRFYVEERFPQDYSRPRLQSGGSGHEQITVKQQNWSMEIETTTNGNPIYHNSSSSYDEDRSRKSPMDTYGDRYPANGYTRPLTPPRDYELESDNEFKITNRDKIRKRQGTTRRVLPQSPNEDIMSNYTSREYATETRL